MSYCYFEKLLNRTDAVIATIAHHLNNPKLGKVDFVTGIGLSGTMPLLSLKERTGCNIVALRKTETTSHGGPWADSTTPSKGQRYVIVDDFISSGGTIRNIIHLLKGFECAGVILYQDCDSVMFEVSTNVLKIPLKEEVNEVIDLIENGCELPWGL